VAADQNTCTFVVLLNCSGVACACRRGLQVELLASDVNYLEVLAVELHNFLRGRGHPDSALRAELVWLELYEVLAMLEADLLKASASVLNGHEATVCFGALCESVVNVVVHHSVVPLVQASACSALSLAEGLLEVSAVDLSCGAIFDRSLEGTAVGETMNGSPVVRDQSGKASEFFRSATVVRRS
jgi:hypothetical protein